MNKFIKYYYLSIIFLVSCAHMESPSGGPPDKTPPHIVEIYPQNKTLNFSDNKVTIKFDKYMNNSSVIENIFIIPDLKMNFDWSGKELEIEFDGQPDSNTTYALTLGADYLDYHNNKPSESFTLVFSTGSKIDSGSIKGFIHDRKPEGIDLYAYWISGINPDTLNPLTTKAEYRTQTGSSGNFSFMALKDGKYRIIAVRDQFKDAIYNEGVDDYGALTADVNLRQDSIPLISLKIGGAIDKIKPRLNDVESLKNRIVLAYLDEKPDSMTITKSAFSLVDSTGADTMEIISACMSKSSPTCIELFTKSYLDTSKTWKLTALNTGTNVLKDLSGNPMDDSSNVRYFTPSAEIDYPEPLIAIMPFRDSTQQVSRSKEISFYLSSPVSVEYLMNKIKFTKLQDSSAVDYDFIAFFDNVITLKPRKPLDNDQWFRIKIDFSKVKDMLGMVSKDSTYILDFKTDDTRNWVRVGGTLQDSSKYGANYIITLESVDLKFRKAYNVGSGGAWSFEEVPPGDYTLEVFCDLDNNSAFTFGSAFPFRFSEPFQMMKEVLKLKPRWNIEDIKIVF